ncbi:MAG: glycoside hydrolase family 2, partial [Muribaculaceae bacterium]|nr:glycoside hydrolase family 2 [Muribaculaceae bacterium]
ESVYLANMESTLKRIRNHPSISFYVSSNESTEVSGAHELIDKLDGTRPYQMQSECDGVHDGSPYKQVNPMQHYTNTASDRGSRVDGFNPEYGAPTLPVVESLRRMMPEEDLWPINTATWDYLDGNGFHLMTKLYNDMTLQYGDCDNIEQYAKQGQLVGAMNSKSIWEVWNRNKLNYGDRFCSGLLFWYHNNPNPQVCARQWDYYLEPTASLYHTANALEPLHIQYDYLTNTVSVVNDRLEPVENLTATATLYDLNSKVVDRQSVKTNVPADGVAEDIITIKIPAGITPVHFISLALTDAKGKELSKNFYWRSDNQFEGPWTLTGPTTAGFQPLRDMPAGKVKGSKKKLGDGKYQVTLSNP